MNRLLLAVLAVAVAGGSARAAVVTVFPSVAPNILISPNGDTYIANAITGLRAGGAPTGTPGTPGFYASLPAGATMTTASLVVTDFNSWLGTYNPAAPFNNEFGNRVHFGFRAVAPAGSREISLSMAEVELDATGPAGALLDVAREFIGGDYAPDFIGIRRNADGTIAEILDAGQAGTERVDELYFFGYGNAFEVLASQFPGGVNQAAFSARIAAESSSQFTFTGRYFVGADTGSSFVIVNPFVADVAIPLPGSVWAFAVGGLVLAAARRRAVRRA